VFLEQVEGDLPITTGISLVTVVRYRKKRQAVYISEKAGKIIRENFFFAFDLVSPLEKDPNQPCLLNV